MNCGSSITDSSTSTTSRFKLCLENETKEKITSEGCCMFVLIESRVLVFISFVTDVRGQGGRVMDKKTFAEKE